MPPGAAMTMTQPSTAAEIADKLAELGSDPEHPLRISALPDLARCAGLYAIRRLGMTSDEPSESAHTGNAAGHGVELWHERPDLPDLDSVMAEVRAAAPARFPLADLETAESLISAYTRDPRNPRRGVVVPGSCEFEVRLTLDPWPSDPTGRPIYLQGHIDQLRWDQESGAFRVWDVKTGGAGVAQSAARGHGLRLLFDHAWQLSAYTLGVSRWVSSNWPSFVERLTRDSDTGITTTWPQNPPPVLPGGVIWLRGYGTRGKSAPESGEAPVFFPALWDLAGCERILASVRYLLARLRSGEVLFTPGAHCAWCVGGPHVCCGESFWPQ